MRCEICCVKKAEKKAPAAAIIDAQSVKTANHPGIRGFDAGKKVMGRKRHVVVDTSGLVLGVLITAANLSDQAGARILLKKVALRFGWVRHVWADAGYLGQKLLDSIHQLLPARGFRIQVVKRNELHRHSFKVLPRRWVVERIFAWLSFSRRFAKDYEVRTDHSAAFIFIAASRLILKRLAR